MKKRNFSITILCFILLALIIAACGGSESVSFGDIPVYPGATEIEPGQNTFVDLMADSMQEAAASEEATTESMIFTAPAGTTWDDVKAFYDSQLSDSDWEGDSTLSLSNEAVSIAGWTRGSGASEQALLVGQTLDPLGTDIFIIVILLTE